MGIGCMEFYLKFVIFLSSLSLLQAEYLIQKTEYLENNQCMMHVTIEGNGIDDVLYMGCDPGEQMDVEVSNGQLLVANSKYPMSAISYQPGELVINDHSHSSLIRRTYHKGQITTNEFLSRRKSPAPSLLNGLRFWFGSKSIASAPTHKDAIVIKSQIFQESSTSCVGSIRVKSIGVDYTEAMSCAQVRDKSVAFSPTGVILAETTSGGVQSIFFDKPGSAVAIAEDNTCKRRTLSKRGPGSDKQSVNLDERSCKYVKSIVDRYLGVRVYRHSYWKDSKCMQDILIRGYGIAEDVKGNTCDKAKEIPISYAPSRGVLIVGDLYARTPIVRGFTDSPDSLIMIHDSACRRHTYTPTLKIERVNYENCIRFRGLMEKNWNDVREGRVEVNHLEFSITRNLPSKGSKLNSDGTYPTVEDILIKERASSSMLRGTPSVMKNVELHTTPLGLILCDYTAHAICVLAEVRNTIHIQKEKCIRVTYENGSGKWIMKVTDEKTCKEAREKVELYKHGDSQKMDIATQLIDF